MKFLGEVRPVAGFISHTFDGIFFQEDENKWLDGFMLKLGKSAVSPCIKNMLLYCLFQACLKKRPYNLFHRANLNIRNSNVAVSFGNRSTWAKSFGDHMLEAYSELVKTQRRSRLPIAVLNSGPVENVAGNFDIVYLDPPYFQTKRTVEPYLLRYHFLEGLARYDEWPFLVDPMSPIRSFKPEVFQGEWASKSTFFSNLQNLIYRHKSSIVVLSYVANSYPSEYALTKYFKSVFKSVVKKKRVYNRALSEKNRNEILLIGMP